MDWVRAQLRLGLHDSFDELPVIWVHLGHLPTELSESEPSKTVTSSNLACPLRAQLEAAAAAAAESGR